MRTNSAYLLACLTLLTAAEPAYAVFPALESDGSFNTGLGTLVLQAVSGRFNTAVGYRALNANTVGESNTALGFESLLSNTTGAGNTAVGESALSFNVTGTENTGAGAYALSSNTTGVQNTAHGWGALASNGTGTANTAVGFLSLSLSTNGENNTGVGWGALASNENGSYNTAVGTNAMFFNTSGDSNTGIGWGALQANTSGSDNLASGQKSMFRNTLGAKNVAMGSNALHANTTGSRNIALGADAGSRLTTGSYNIDIGHTGVAKETKTIRIGKQGTQLKTYLAGVRGVTVSGGAAVMVSKTGQLGVQTSSRRYKQDIQPMGEISAALLRLKPVTFHYKVADEQGEKPLQFGLIAEDVAQVLPQLVVYDDHNQPETVAYQALSSLLLNEFQIEHQRRLMSEAQSQQELAALKVRTTAAEARATAAIDGLVLARAQALRDRQELAALRAQMKQMTQTVQRLLTAQAPAPSVAAVAP